MNIDDVIPTGERSKTPKDFFRVVFGHQTELMERYHDIEAKAGVVMVTLPVSIDDPKAQMRLKDMFWRATEEIAEALEEVEQIDFTAWMNRWNDDSKLRHFFEELADALHFLSEATIIAGIHAEDIAAEAVIELAAQVYNPNEAPSHLEMRLRGMDFVRNLGLAANCLKNKPWKQTHMATDERKFYSLMVKSWISFMALFLRTGMRIEQIEALYLKKHQVNRFRQDSKY